MSSKKPMNSLAELIRQAGGPAYPTATEAMKCFAQKLGVALSVAYRIVRGTLAVNTTEGEVRVMRAIQHMFVDNWGTEAPGHTFSDKEVLDAMYQSWKQCYEDRLDNLERRQKMRVDSSSDIFFWNAAGSVPDMSTYAELPKEDRPPLPTQHAIRMLMMEKYADLSRSSTLDSTLEGGDE